MKSIFAIAVAASLAASAPVHAETLGQAVLDELNFVRTRPADYAEELRAAAQSRYRDDAFLYEDPQALDEAIDFLERQQPLPPLDRDRRLEAAARAHVSTQGPRGDLGHGGRTSFGQRLRAQGMWASLSAEDISYGYGDPRDVVRQLVVDSGVPNRGHRANIFGRGYQLAGVACGPHEAYGEMCVIDFAGGVPQR